MTSRQLDRFLETRLRTLEMTAGLTQEQSDFAPSSDAWSVGEVLDHLARLDGLMRREFEALLERARGDRVILVFRRLADFESPLNRIPGWIRPVFEVVLALLAVLLPRAVRQMVLRRRFVPAKSPYAVLPRRQRPLTQLRTELREMSSFVRQLSADHPDVRIDRLYYYNPLTGLTTLPGMLAILSGHDSRHQEQLRDIMMSPGFLKLRPLAQPRALPHGARSDCGPSLG